MRETYSDLNSISRSNDSFRLTATPSGMNTAMNAVAMSCGGQAGVIPVVARCWPSAVSTKSATWSAVKAKMEVTKALSRNGNASIVASRFHSSFRITVLSKVRIRATVMARAKANCPGLQVQLLS